MSSFVMLFFKVQSSIVLQSNNEKCNDYNNMIRIKVFTIDYRQDSPHLIECFRVPKFHFRSPFQSLCLSLNLDEHKRFNIPKTFQVMGRYQNVIISLPLQAAKLRFVAFTSITQIPASRSNGKLLLFLFSSSSKSVSLTTFFRVLFVFSLLAFFKKAVTSRSARPSARCSVQEEYCVIKPET